MAQYKYLILAHLIGVAVSISSNLDLRIDNSNSFPSAFMGIGSVNNIFNLYIDMWSNQISVVTDKCPNNECPRDNKFRRGLTFDASSTFANIEYTNGTCGGFYGKDYICINTGCTAYKM